MGHFEALFWSEFASACSHSTFSSVTSLLNMRLLRPFCCSAPHPERCVELDDVGVVQGGVQPRLTKHLQHITCEGR